MFSKLILTMYKSSDKNVDDFLDKTTRNTKDSFSSHKCGYMSDEKFPKANMMKILRARIALKFQSTEETNFGLDNVYSSTLNRKNEAMAGVEEIYCEPVENLNVNDHMDLGEEHFLKLDDGGSEIDWSLGYNINHNYNWVKELKLKLKNSLDDKKNCYS